MLQFYCYELVCICKLDMGQELEMSRIQKLIFSNVYSCLDVKQLIKFLKEIEDGSIVLMTTFDDPATK